MHRPSAALTYGRAPTLQRLLDEPDLELKLVAGSADRAARVMSGIHLTEILEVERWLAEGWVMMTTGVLLERRPQAQRALVRALHGINATGLGYCLGIVTKNVPAALIDEARNLDFPLFVMPLHIKARDVATRANRMILANDETMLEQALGTQDVFFERFETVADPDWLPERQLVENLAALLGLPVSFHGSDAGAPAQNDPIGQALITAPTHAPITKRVDNADLLIVPARVGAMFVGWLVASLPADFEDGRTAMKVVGAVARLVALAVLSRKRTATNTRAVRQEVMGQIIGLAKRAPTPADLVRLLGQEGVLSVLRDLGFEPAAPIRGVLVEAADADSLDAAIDELDRQGAPYVSIERDLTSSIMTQLPADSIREVIDRCRDVVAGVGGELDGVGQIMPSLEQARDAMNAAPRMTPTGDLGPRCLVFDDLPLSSWMIHRDPTGSPAAKARQTLAPLRASPAIFDTVVAYFAHDMDVARCAEALFIHPNSVRYRLSRAEKELQVSLHDPAAIADLYLAFRVVREL